MLAIGQELAPKSARYRLLSAETSPISESAYYPAYHNSHFEQRRCGACTYVKEVCNSMTVRQFK
jgi:hypothetical protein